MNKILIIHTWGIGDMIMFTPFLVFLKKEYPSISIDFFITQKPAFLPIKNSDLVDKVYYADYNIKSMFHVSREIRKTHYDICFHTSGISPFKYFLFSMFVNSDYRYGEYRHIPNIFLSKQVKYDNTIHRYESNLKILSLFSNASHVSKVPVFYLSESEKMFADDFIKDHQLQNKFLFGIHPGCNKKSINRRWSKEKFVEVIEFLQKKYPMIRILLFVGPDEEEDGDFIEVQTKVIKVSKTSLGQTASLIAKCKWFLNTDSGLGHIASCFDCKIFTIFGPADSRLSRVISDNAEIIKSGLKCQPCEILNPTHCNLECLRDLKSSVIINIIDKRLEVENLC
jgi:heptosyltransferase-2